MCRSLAADGSKAGGVSQHRPAVFRRMFSVSCDSSEFRQEGRSCPAPCFSGALCGSISAADRSGFSAVPRLDSKNCSRDPLDTESRFGFNAGECENSITADLSKEGVAMPHHAAPPLNLARGRSPRCVPGQELSRPCTLAESRSASRHLTNRAPVETRPGPAARDRQSREPCSPDPPSVSGFACRHPTTKEACPLEPAPEPSLWALPLASGRGAGC